MGFFLVSTNDRTNVEISLFCMVGSVSREGQGIQDVVCGVPKFLAVCCFDCPLLSSQVEVDKCGFGMDEENLMVFVAR